jgi:hypothetical protein
MVDRAGVAADDVADRTTGTTSTHIPVAPTRNVSFSLSVSPQAQLHLSTSDAALLL